MRRGTIYAMCGRYVRARGKREYARAFGLPDADAPHSHGGDMSPCWNMAPSLCSWVLRTEAWGKPGIVSLRWGLLPGWVKDAKSASRPINARAETAHDKPYFREPFRYKRCLVAADGFYEWKKTPSGKQPYYIRLKGGAPMAFAGLWDEWATSTAEQHDVTFTILTTEPNALTAEIHDRMPVIVKPKDYMRWIDPQVRDVQEVRAMIAPYPAEDMEAWPVSSRVNDPKNNDAQLVAPLT